MLSFNFIIVLLIYTGSMMKRIPEIILLSNYLSCKYSKVISIKNSGLVQFIVCSDSLNLTVRFNENYAILEFEYDLNSIMFLLIT